ncbi:MAG: hypothetical protein JSV34_04410, partial [Candidatus Omnitrophota bacterium]
CTRKINYEVQIKSEGIDLNYTKFTKSVKFTADEGKIYTIGVRLLVDAEPASDWIYTEVSP